MTSAQEARVLANRILDRPSGDPDDDLATLSRELLRADEKLKIVCESLLETLYCRFGRNTVAEYKSVYEILGAKIDELEATLAAMRSNHPFGSLYDALRNAQTERDGLRADLARAGKEQK